MQNFELYTIILIIIIVFICCVFLFYKTFQIQAHSKYSTFLTNRLHRPVSDTTDPYLLYRYVHQSHDRFLDHYPDHIDEIKKKTKSMSIIITGLIRNHGKPIIHQLVTYWIPFLKNNFKDFHIILLENDSSDNTRSLLEQMKKTYTPHITLLSFPYSTPNFHQNKVSTLERTNMMATLRNQLLHHLYQEFTLNRDETIKKPMIFLEEDSTLVLMMDPDLMGVMHEDAFLHGVYTLVNNPFLVGVGCNTITTDHRIFDTFPFVPIHDSFEWTTEKDKNRHDEYIQQRYSRNVVWERSQPLVMYSTFNGMMLYSFSRLMKITDTIIYYPMISEQEKNSICEHSRFHLQFPMGSIALDPLWIFQLKKNLF